MAKSMTTALRSLLFAMNLGRSTAHPLAGWHVLTILYRDGSTSGEPMTMGYLVRRYNDEYLDGDERRVDDNGLAGVLKMLVNQASLVEATTRKVRERMKSGKFHIVMSSVYKINAAGIEFLTAMQRVIDAENTVVASTKRIDEYCELVATFQHYKEMPVDSIALFDNFNRMLSAYDEVVNGLRKLDVDLHEVSANLTFDQMGTAAEHLQAMLHEQAIPAYQRMINQAGLLQWLNLQPKFAVKIALSRHAKGNLDVNVAIQDDDALELERSKTQNFVQRRMQAMVSSFDPTSTAISNSFDSIYLLFQTLISASQLLAREYEHVRRQTIDIQALTSDIDKLIAKANRIVLPQALPTHLPMDRLNQDELTKIEQLSKSERGEAMTSLTNSVLADMLEAGTMGPVTRPVAEANRVVVSEADNPEVVSDVDLVASTRAAMREFNQLVMAAPNLAQVTSDLTFANAAARDAVVTLYAATEYHGGKGNFSVFGRNVISAKAVNAVPVTIRLAGESYIAVLPRGFSAKFAEEG